MMPCSFDYHDNVCVVTMTNGQTIVDAEEAARLYDSAARHYYGEFARLNFPNDPPVPFEPKGK